MTACVLAVAAIATASWRALLRQATRPLFRASEATTLVHFPPFRLLF